MGGVSFTCIHATIFHAINYLQLKTNTPTVRLRVHDDVACLDNAPDGVYWCIGRRTHFNRLASISSNDLYSELMRLAIIIRSPEATVPNRRA